MPSPVNSLCIFGDSNMACVKHALNQDMVTVPDGLSIEFWGANGARFRALDLIDNKLVPRPAALETVLMVNGHGRKVLDPSDFDAILFLGVRMRVNNFVAPLMHRLTNEDEFLSSAVIGQCCRDWFANQRFYKAAKAFAQTGRTKVILTCNSLQLENSPESQNDLHPHANLASNADMGRIWAEFDRIAKADGISFMPQMQDTITAGICTKAKYIRRNVDGTFDRKHRSPDYGAVLLQEVLTYC